MNGRMLSKGNPFLNQDIHGEQVVPDHDQVTVQNKDNIENYKYNSLEHSYKTEKGKCLWWELNPMPLICQMSTLDC